jgi:phage baseplate assembly protein W
MTAPRTTPPSFLGTGWSFPPTFHAGGAALAVVDGPDNVHKSIALLLHTRPGERPMQEDYGCALDEALFGELDQQLVNRIQELIRDAVLHHEPRVAVTGLDVTPDKDDPGVLRVRLDYTIRGENTRYNLVFPFYLKEATSVAR